MDGYRGAPVEVVIHNRFNIPKESVGPNLWLYFDISAQKLIDGEYYGFAIAPAADDRKGDLTLFWATTDDDSAYRGGSANQFNLYDPKRGWFPQGPYGNAKRDLTFDLKTK